MPERRRTRLGAGAATARGTKGVLLQLYRQQPLQAGILLHLGLGADHGGGRVGGHESPEALGLGGDGRTSSCWVALAVIFGEGQPEVNSRQRRTADANLAASWPTSSSPSTRARPPPAPSCSTAPARQSPPPSSHSSRYTRNPAGWSTTRRGSGARS